ncbi:MAG: tRNA pseudouridine synthase B [Lapillicoccus sp.]
MAAPDGLLVVDKPAGWTSHDVVARARRMCGTRRVGHAGTLDPMATGVLVLGVNRATRLLTFLVGCDKTYTATVRLGQSTVTDDAAGEITASTDVGHSGTAVFAPGDLTPDVLPDVLTPDVLTTAMAALTGDIEQVPSSVSAVKVAGVRSYARVRRGEQVDLQARKVTVRRFELGDRRLLTVTDASGTRHLVLDIDVEVDVSSGTYVRALARDLGAALGVGGHLTALRRTRVGRFDLTMAHDLAELSGRLETDGPSGAAGSHGIPILALSDAARAQFPVRELTEAEATAIGHGQRIESRPPLRGEPVAAFAPDGRLVAMLDESGRLARTHVVFAPTGS